TAAQQLVEPRNMPPAPGLSGSTLRQVIHASVGGSTLRVRLANTFGDGPLAVTAAHVARSLGGSAIEVASDRALTFAGADSVRIAPGAAVTSDPLDYAVPALGDLVVTIEIATAPGPATLPCSTPASAATRCSRAASAPRHWRGSNATSWHSRAYAG